MCVTAWLKHFRAKDKRVCLKRYGRWKRRKYIYIIELISLLLNDRGSNYRRNISACMNSCLRYHSNIHSVAIEAQDRSTIHSLRSEPVTQSVYTCRKLSINDLVQAYMYVLHKTIITRKISRNISFVRDLYNTNAFRH